MPQGSSSEQPSTAYRGYEGNQGREDYAQHPYGPPPYSAPGSAPGAGYDDDYVESLAQRLSQRMAQGPQGKIYSGPPASQRVSPGQRLALAIVSIAVLVPLAAILVAGVQGIIGLIAFVAASLAIFLINAVFSALR